MLCRAMDPPAGICRQELVLLQAPALTAELTHSKLLAQDRRAAERPANGAGRQSMAGQQPSASSEVRGRLLLDCMGHWSPIVKQMRGMQQPDGMCLVVGGCASGFTPENNKCALGAFLLHVPAAAHSEVCDCAVWLTCLVVRMLLAL